MWPLAYLTSPGQRKASPVSNVWPEQNQKAFLKVLPTKGTWAACSVAVLKSIPPGALSLPPAKEPTRDRSCHIHSSIPVHPGTTSHHGGTHKICHLCNPQCCFLSLLHKVCKVTGKLSVCSHLKDPHFGLRQSGSAAWMLQGLWKSSEIPVFYSDFILPKIIRVFLSPPHWHTAPPTPTPKAAPSLWLPRAPLSKLYFIRGVSVLARFLLGSAGWCLPIPCIPQVKGTPQNVLTPSNPREALEIVRLEDSSWISEDSQDCRVHMINFREVLTEITLA